MFARQSVCSGLFASGKKVMLERKLAGLQKRRSLFGRKRESQIRLDDRY